MNFLTVICIISTLVNICTILYMVKTISALNDARDKMESNTNLIVKLYKISNEYEEKTINNVIRVFEEVESDRGLHKEICKAYEKMYNAYISSQIMFHTCEERYSDAYEQFKHCSNELTELKEKVNRPFYTGSDEMESEDAS